MKKLSLLTLLLTCILAFRHADAQVILTQDFESPTIPALPTGWTQNSIGSGTSYGWNTGTYSGIASCWGIGGSHPGQIALVDDCSSTTSSNLRDTLKSPVFSLSGMSNPWLNFDYVFLKETYSGGTERAFVLGSTDGGGTWTVLDSLAPILTYWPTAHFSLAPLGMGANRRIAITYTDANVWNYGCAIDNVQIVNLTSRDAAITAHDYNSKLNGISANGEPVSFTIENRGVAISSLSVYYRINGGAPVVQNFTGLSIAPYGTQNFTFATLIAGAVAGSNSIRVGVLSVNGLSNAEPVDTVQTSVFARASISVQRNGLIEKYGSSTTPPDASFSTTFDPLTNSMHADSVGGTFNLIKYQMNWVTPGNDRSYNPDAETRKLYYGVNSIPDYYINGVKNSLTTSAPGLTAEINAASAKKAFLDITATYLVDTFAHKVHVVTNVTPHFTKTGNYHVYVALLDSYYENTTHTTGQLQYYHVMRKMLPSAAGHAVTSWVDGVTQTFYDTGVAYTNGNWMLGSTSYPVQGSYTFWRNPLLNSETVAFVEEDATKSVMQSQVFAPTPACIPPAAAMVTGTSTLCIGSTATLSGSVTGGTWSSSDLAVATVSSSGVLSGGVMPGTAIISYTINNTCGATSTTHIVTINAAPTPTYIIGSFLICAGSTATLSPGTSGGSWTSSAPGVATVTSGGAVTGVSGGTANISYTLTNSCGSATVVQDMTINPLPAAGTLTGAASICVGGTIALTPSVSGGTWSSSASGIASVAGGVVVAVAIGTADISYTVTNSCGTASTAHAVVVTSAAPPPVTITGSSTVCEGSTLTLTPSAAGGSWTSSTPGVATVSGGVVSGVTGGTANISYTLTNGCGFSNAEQAVTVNPLPNAGAITAPDTICIGATATLSESVSGGTWSVSAAGHAMVSVAGVLAGVSAGVDMISYTVTNSCGTATTNRMVIIANCNVQGVDDITVSEDVRIHPNPVQNIVTITSGGNIGSIVITNMVGQKVHSGVYNTTTAAIDMSLLPGGVYFLKVNDSKVFKVVKQ